MASAGDGKPGRVFGGGDAAVVLAVAVAADATMN